MATYYGNLLVVCKKIILTADANSCEIIRVK